MDVAADAHQANVTIVTRPMAVCTCGWKQLHESDENAQRDAEQHQKEWHGR